MFAIEWPIGELLVDIPILIIELALKFLPQRVDGHVRWGDELEVYV